MNSFNTQLCDLIHVEEGVIPADLCDSIVEEIEENEWSPHIWQTDSYAFSEDSMELDVQNANEEHHQLLTPFVFQAGQAYNAKYAFDCERTKDIVHMVSAIRFNRYSPGQIMRQHHDHIDSLFDGNQRGIPVLSFVLNLNDNYEGGELFFWDDYTISLGKGDIIMFPSLFLFPHGVREATKGKRYSAVCWAW